MSESLQRFNVDYNGESYPDENGEFVRYEDAARLLGIEVEEDTDQIPEDPYEDHTPGPWTHNAEDHDGCHNIYSTDEWGLRGGEIAFTAGFSNEKVEKANTRLLAAAPELLAEVIRLRAENAELADDQYVYGASIIAEKQEEIDRLKLELEELRKQVPVWVAVTDDPATIPEIGRLVIVRYGDSYVTGVVSDDNGTRPLHVLEMTTGAQYSVEFPGDSWTYVLGKLDD